MKNKVVIITGGTSGIGRACAEVFGSQGAKIIITGRNEEMLAKVSLALNQKSIDHIPIQADVTQLSDNQKVIDLAIEKYGRIDVLINNAGISMRALFSDLNMHVIERVMEINFFGAVKITQLALPYILKSKGSIVGVSSIAGYRGLPFRTGYSASKFALQGFLEALRTELLPTGVHVLVACPGFTASNIRNTALAKDGSQQGESPRDESKMMSAEEVARHIYKATVKRKRTLILTAKGKLTVFLNKFFPKWMDKLVYKEMIKEKGAPTKD